MTRIPATVVVALLLLVSPVVAATPAGGVDPASADGATPSIEHEVAAPAVDATSLTESAGPISWITHDGQSSRGVAGETARSIGSTLGMADRDLRAELTEARYENRFEAGDTSAERQAVLDEALADMERRHDRLVEREREAIAEHAAGERSTEAFLRELAKISADASAVERRLDHLDRLADRDADVEISTRNLRYAMSRFDTPIRNDLVAATTAGGPVGERIYVETSENTAVLSKIEGDQYLREGIQTDQYDPDGTEQFQSREEVLETAGSHYPWLYSLAPNEREPSSRTYGTTTRETVNNHPAGSSRIFLDSSTKGVFLEYHTLDLAALDQTATVRPSDSEFTVGANRVPNGGPLWVNVTDDGGDPIDATVTIGDGHTARTGDDGVAWLFAPEGDVTVTVSAPGAAENATVTVRALSG
ncbi:carboxypeptidase-like regulatory domain-containing protein [Natronoarchaeum mannanilyticum]|uniref:carboxypeptidase-like regulatory domain-containing protein n=1 Tax=Natronoarchaeum mannanilyticum TaxID=926360 RepID=UPI00362316FF